MKKIIAVFAVMILMLILVAGCGRGQPAPTATTALPAASAPAPVGENLFLEIFQPADEKVVDSSRITVSGKTLADAVVSINGEFIDINYDGTFVREVNLDAGPNVIEVVAGDFSGNEKSVLLTVIYAAALYLTVNEPVNEVVVHSQTLTVRGTTNEEAVVSINGKIAVIDASGNFYSLITLESGPNLVEVLASDFFGHSAGTTLTVIYAP
jgi:hypothetical protein